MKAVVITSYGGVEGIDVQEVETPAAPVADRVRVRVHAAGLNHRKSAIRSKSLFPQSAESYTPAPKVFATGDAHTRAGRRSATQPTFRPEQRGQAAIQTDLL